MENKNNKIIYVKTGEEIISIVNRIKQCEKDEVTLLVPFNALLLKSVVNLKVLKKKAGEARKNISIITTDKNGMTIENKQAPKTENKTANNLTTANKRENKKIRIFDIVRKIDKTNNTKLSENNSDTTNHKIETETEVKNAPESKPKEEWFNEEKDIKASKIASVDISKKEKKRKTILPVISSKVFATFIFSCFAITALIAFFVFQKVNIIIALKAQETSYNFEFVTDEAIEEIDTTYNKIPVERIEVVSEKTEAYSATGKKRMTEKAGGEITVYNEYSSNPQKIVANTRFLSKEGKLFKITKSITIPGFSRVEGKDVPGEVTATVYADVAGEEYNIDASSFTLPGLQGHPKYASVYARSTQAMSGGIDKDVLYFSESDYITAKEKLVKIAEEESEQDFSSKISEQVLLLENTKEFSETEVKTNIKVGAVADNFEMTVLVKTNALFIDKNNLADLITAKINSELGKNMELVEGSRNYEIKETIQNENGSVRIPVYVTQDLITKIDTNKIREEIAGKNELELNNYFNNIREIESVNIKFWPEWIKSVPASWDKINIEFEK
ncbi:MAG: hypothetical protein U9N04_04415 [Patescibacteria group bacterium]|nr:hypothetical protein [Patescibacteria group bacterium]